MYMLAIKTKKSTHLTRHRQNSHPSLAVGGKKKFLRILGRLIIAYPDKFPSQPNLYREIEFDGAVRRIKLIAPIITNRDIPYIARTLISIIDKKAPPVLAGPGNPGGDFNR
jgi:hypothetical protein